MSSTQVLRIDLFYTAPGSHSIEEGPLKTEYYHLSQDNYEKAKSRGQRYLGNGLTIRVIDVPEDVELHLKYVLESGYEHAPSQSLLKYLNDSEADGVYLRYEEVESMLPLTDLKIRVRRFLTEGGNERYVEDSTGFVYIRKGSHYLVVGKRNDFDEVINLTGDDYITCEYLKRDVYGENVEYPDSVLVGGKVEFVFKKIGSKSFVTGRKVDDEVFPLSKFDLQLCEREGLSVFSAGEE